MASTRAFQLKEEGNKRFQAQEYVDAEALYSKAINIDPTNPLLYTNRAMARLKLHLYESVIPDCKASLELLSENMKAYYHLAQAEIELDLLEEAYGHAQKAYELCSGIKTGVVDKTWERSLGPVTALVLRCKKELWEQKENERLKTRHILLEDLRDLLSEQKACEKRELQAEADYSEEKGIKFESKWQMKEEELTRLWESAADADGKKRQVPDWAIDNITFAVMYDPVMTKTGQSYERASISEHLRRSATDPLTREPLRVEDLRPNIGLKAACTEFLAENGWAVDW